MTDRGYALITGASQGIGAAIALELAREGFGVVLTARSTEALEQVRADAATLNGGRAHALPLDLSDPDAVALIQRFLDERKITLTCLVNNAGYAHWGLFGKVPIEEHRKLMYLNMSVPVALTCALLPTLRRAQRAWILNTSSMTAYQPLASMALYAASKAFILYWSRALRIELKGTGLSVTALCPGSVITGFTANAGMKEMDDLAKKFGMPPAPVAKAAVRAMLNGRAEVVPGLLNRITHAVQSLLPMSLNENAASGIYLKRLRRKGGA